MVLDGFGGEEEVSRNLGVGAPGGDQGQDLDFTRREVRGVGPGGGTWSAGNVPDTEVIQPLLYLVEGWSRSELLEYPQCFAECRLVVAIDQRPCRFVGTAEGAPGRGCSAQSPPICKANGSAASAGAVG